MSLEFKICPGCHTSHAIMRNGQMSIHSNASGVRCQGSGDPEAHIKDRQQAAEHRRRAHEDALDQVEEMRELQAAFGVANAKRRREPDKPKQGFDRRIYAVGGAHIISGGLPTHGKRH